MMKLTGLLCAGLLLSGAALAADCLDNPEASQTELNMCSAELYDKADAALNKSWQRVVKRTSGAQRAQLKKAQQAWIALRDADCAFISSGSEGGSGQPMVYNQCATDKTEERTRWLDGIANCPEGDMSCPLPPAH